MDVLLVRIIVGICARLFICSRAYVGSLVVPVGLSGLIGYILTQLPVRSCRMVVITVNCARYAHEQHLSFRGQSLTEALGTLGRDTYIREGEYV